MDQYYGEERIVIIGFGVGKRRRAVWYSFILLRDRYFHVGSTGDGAGIFVALT